MKRSFWVFLTLVTLVFVVAWRIYQRTPGPNKSYQTHTEIATKTGIDSDQLLKPKTDFDQLNELSNDEEKSEPVATVPLEQDKNQDTIPNEWLMQFGSRADMEEAIRLAKAAGIQVTGQIDALNALRLRATTQAQRDALSQIGSEAEELGSNYFVRLPAPPPSTENQSPTGNTGFGAGTMDFLGVPDNNDSFGAGVTIAVLDTGIDLSHPTFDHANIQTFSLVDNPAGPDPSGHGTAVASLIVGADENAQGIAPAAELLSFQVMDANGSSDSFTIAQGIIQAVDAGADIISLSLGSYGDSPILKNAVNYALNHQVAVVAAAGNDGVNQLPYPARYAGVVGVAAVDANSRPAYFSNYSDGVDVAAPGINIYSAGEEESIVGFSGTSASTPLVAGSIAVILSEQSHLGAPNAASYLTEHSNDAGAPGKDPHYGSGILNIERIRKSNPGYDVAISDFYLDFDQSSPNAISMKITVQNRGTKYLSGIKLDYILEGNQYTAYLGNLDTNEVSYHKILLNPNYITNGPGTVVQSTVTHDRTEDVAPENNSRASLVHATQK